MGVFLLLLKTNMQDFITIILKSCLQSTDIFGLLSIWLTFWSVSEYIFPMIWAAIFRVSVVRSSKALWMTGMMRARDGASTKWTNLVWSNLSRQTVVLRVGSCNACIKLGTIAEERIFHTIKFYQNKKTKSSSSLKTCCVH